jgi:glutamate-1-semialdehyde 2,1-aminomutase
LNEQELWNKQVSLTPTGCQTNSKAPDRYVEGVYPKFIDRGYGGNVVDLNGKLYVDFIAALGAVSVGYNNLYITDAIKEQLNKGISFSLPNVLEGQVAEKISQLVPSMQMSKFTKTGSDACSMAIKCARAYTGRTEIVAIGYHGWHDWYTASTDKKSGIPYIYELFIRRCDYGNLKLLTSLVSEHTAAIILEPVVFKELDPKYLEEVIKLAHLHKAIVIFDETVTGGRFAQFTAQKCLRRHA